MLLRLVALSHDRDTGSTKQVVEESMSALEDPALLLDALSTRVLRTLTPDAWRKLFLRPYQEVMRWTPAGGTLLCAAAQLPAWGAGAGLATELAFLAATHGGELDPCPPTTALVHFADPLAAFDMALEMQQMACDARFQIGLVSGDCSIATLQLEGRELRMFVGGAVEQAETVARQAAPGTIRISPETYTRLQEAVGSVGSWMLTSEYEGERMTSASLTPPPRPSSALSTFAGLGLT
jgi:hypothetical protein